MNSPSPDTWDPEVYGRFSKERSLPFLDLLALVERVPGMRVLDLGCGTGELTRLLHETLAASETLGLDSSARMLEKAAGFAGDGLSFGFGDIATFTTGRPFDLVFSNAALHWVPGHPALLARLSGLLAPRGQLAVQVPDMDGQVSHATAREVASEEPFASALDGGPRVSPVLSPEAYAETLFRLGFAEQSVRLQVYGQVLGGPEDVVEWVKGTLLTDYRRRLAPGLWDLFLARYRERLLARLDNSRPFFYPYRRILFRARRG